MSRPPRRWNTSSTPLIYRVHDTPSKEKLFAFSDFLRTLNINFAKGQVVQPGVFNRVLARPRAARMKR